MEAEQIVMYAESSKRIISRAPIAQTIGWYRKKKCLVVLMIIK
jgi:hypothetical protein